MSEKLQPESYESRIDLAVMKVLEIVSGIENTTVSLKEISEALAVSAQADSNQGLVGEVLEALSGIFKTMADSAGVSTHFAGFEQNTAYLFASPFVETDVKEVFKLLISQGIGTRHDRKI